MDHTAHSQASGSTPDGGRRGACTRRTLLRLGAGVGAGSATAGAGWSTAGAAPEAVPAPWSALAAELEGELYRPGDADYDTARLLFSPRFDGVHPSAVAYCAGAHDVRGCVDFARRHGVPVAVRSGGHSYAGWSSGRGLIIDVQRLAGVALSGDTATIGAGAKLIDVYDQLSGRGSTVPAGSCPTVGISGLALGGGVGVMARAYGMTCDSLTGASVVTADGRLREVSPRQHPGLFWALRGAGNANFGVVTSLRFRTRPAEDSVVLSLSWPWSRAAEVVDAWQRWGPSAPDGLWSYLLLTARTGERPAELTVGGLSLEGATETENQLDRLAERIGAAPHTARIRSLPFLEAMREMGGVAGWSTEEAHLPGTLPGRTPRGRIERGTYTARSHFFARPTPPAGTRSLLGWVERLETLTAGGEGTMMFDALGGAVNRVAPDSTAFVHREARFLGQFLVSWSPENDHSEVSRYRAWLDGAHRAAGEWANGHAYQNYTDPRLRDWRRAYYGSNAERLARLKSRYDPERLFTYPQAV